MPAAFIFPINPLLMAGAALIGVPILIHLLNKRRFRIVEWAAMDLLLKAEQRNRRRLRMEDLIVLLLRCLALIILACLLARLVLDPSGLGLRDVKSVRVERIVILDDSPSMDVQQGNRSEFDRTTEALADFAKFLARERAGDTLTVILTSRPQQPMLNGQILTDENVDAIAASLESIKPSAMVARVDNALLALDEMIGKEADAEGTNRILYIVSDFRKTDWMPIDGAETGGVPEKLAEISTKVQDVLLVDPKLTVTQNLAITDLRPIDRNLIAGLPSRFEVTVANYGIRDFDGGEVILATEGGTPIRKRLSPIAPGRTETLVVPVQMTSGQSTVITAELDQPDQVAHDNRRYFAGDVQPGISVLIVDGEPDLNAYRSESFYLKQALAPPGDQLSGVKVEVVDEHQFAARSLKDIQVLFLCNVFRMTEERTKELHNWIKAGGGLVVFPGDLTDPGYWNETLPGVSKELALATFDDVQGDISERNWQEFKLTQASHPIVQAFAGEQNPFLSRVKIYRYWQLTMPEKSNASVIAEFSSGKPAIIEAAIGLGKMIITACPADAEWSIWPSDPSYLITSQQMVHYLARGLAGTRNLQVGTPLWHELDTSLYRSEAELRAPESDYPTVVRAATDVDSGAIGLNYKDINVQGPWMLTLNSHEGESTKFHFAANVDSRESDQTKLARPEFMRLLGDDVPVRFVDGPAIPGTDDAGSKAELAKFLAVLLLIVLFVEQFLAWHFRRRHQVS